MQWIDSASDRAGRPLPPRLLEPGDQPLALCVDLDGRFIERATLAGATRLDADLVCLLARLHHLLPAARPDKGEALATLMRLPRFRGRAPVMLGEHASVEPAFARAQELGGVGMVVGLHRPTLARHALGAPRQAGRWLAALALRLEQDRAAG